MVAKYKVVIHDVVKNMQNRKEKEQKKEKEQEKEQGGKK